MPGGLYYMTIHYVNTGSSPNAGNGDSLRVAFNKINANFEYISTSSFSGTVLGDRLTSGTSELVFSDAGYLQFPDASRISTTVGETATFQAMNAFAIQTAKFGPTWTFGTDGVLTLPAGGDIVDSNGDTVLGGTGGSSDSLVNGDSSFNISPDGTLTLTHPDEPNYHPLETQLIIQKAAGNYHTISGAYGLSLQATPVPSGYGLNTNTNFVDIFHDGVSVNVNDNTWGFGTDGTLTAPGHLLPDADLAYDLGSTSSQWRSIYVGTGTIFIGGVALGVNQDNYVTVDGNPIITVNTTGNITIQGDVVIGTVTISDTAPVANTGTQWFNTIDGRTYIAYNGHWLDASPTQIPSPETYLDDIQIDGSTLSVGDYAWTFGGITDTFPGDIYDADGPIVRFATTSTAPSRANGQLWFNSEEGRTYIKYNGAWVDANPTQIPGPETYLDDIQVDGSEFLINGYSLTVDETGTLLVDGEQVTGGGSGWQLTSSTAVVSLSSTGTLTLPDGGTITEGAGPFTGAIRLEPSGASSSTQALLIYPTAGAGDGNHIHLTADGGETDLYLGNDNQYVKIDHSGTVVIGTLGVSTSTWIFGTDGILSLPTFVGSPSIAIIQSTSPIGLDANGKGWIFGTDGSTTFPNDTILGTGLDPNVYIETVSTSTTSTWSFGTDGILTLPAATPVIKGGGTGTDVAIVASTGTNPAVWTFEADGSLTLPNGMIIDASDSIPTVTIGGPNTKIRIDDGGAPPGFYITTNATSSTAYGWLFGPEGELEFPQGSTISETIATTGTHGTTIIQAGTNNDLLLKTWDYVNSTIRTWTFGIDGSLTLPNGTNIAIPAGTPRTGAIAITSSTELLIGTNTTTTNNLWTFGIDGSTVFPDNTVKGYCFTATNAVFNYLPQAAQFLYTDSPILSLISTISGPWYIKGPGLVGWKPITAVQDNGGVALIIRIGSGNTPLGDGSEFYSGGYNPTSPDLVYTISQYLELDLKAADKTWTLSSTGTITFPDATVQTTAYVAANVVNKTSGSWTLATGANTVSITVAPGNNYQMWVNGTCDNGIVEWNATVNVSNTNVPVVGSQYGWYYAAGNALVLTSMPNQIVGTAGSISTATVATTTSNVFTFGITNNSVSTQTVYWGYTTL